MTHLKQNDPFKNTNHNDLNLMTIFWGPQVTPIMMTLDNTRRKFMIMHSIISAVQKWPCLEISQYVDPALTER